MEARKAAEGVSESKMLVRASFASAFVVAHPSLKIPFAGSIRLFKT
jgi:hypothetical protein